jgi:hypothetical protein
MGVLRRVRLLTERRFGGLSSFSSGGLRSLLGRAAEVWRQQTDSQRCGCVAVQLGRVVIVNFVLVHLRPASAV